MSRPNLPPVFEGFRSHYEQSIQRHDAAEEDQSHGWYTEKELCLVLGTARSSLNFHNWIKTLRCRPSTRIDSLGRPRPVMVYSLPPGKKEAARKKLSKKSRTGLTNKTAARNRKRASKVALKKKARR